MARSRDKKAVARGQVLFEREWQPGDSRTHGGDGLGPVYNDSSCVACHNLGGTGGAGSNGQERRYHHGNSERGPVRDSLRLGAQQPTGFLIKALRSLVGLDKPAPAKGVNAAKPARPKVDTKELVKAHPGFRNGAQRRSASLRNRREIRAWRQTFAGFEALQPFRRCHRAITA